MPAAALKTAKEKEMKKNWKKVLVMLLLFTAVSLGSAFAQYRRPGSAIYTTAGRSDASEWGFAISEGSFSMLQYVQIKRVDLTDVRRVQVSYDCIFPVGTNVLGAATMFEFTPHFIRPDGSEYRGSTISNREILMTRRTNSTFTLDFRSQQQNSNDIIKCLVIRFRKEW